MRYGDDLHARGQTINEREWITRRKDVPAAAVCPFGPTLRRFHNSVHCCVERQHETASREWTTFGVPVPSSLGILDRMRMLGLVLVEWFHFLGFDRRDLDANRAIGILQLLVRFKDHEASPVGLQFAVLIACR